MKVELLEHTAQPDKLAAIAARSCHSKKGSFELRETEDEEDLKRVLHKNGRKRTYVRGRTRQLHIQRRRNIPSL